MRSTERMKPQPPGQHQPSSASTPFNPPPDASRADIRRWMRDRRRSLDQHQQVDAARCAARLVTANTLFRRSQHIAFYLSNDGELDPWPLLTRAWALGKRCYLPIITRNGRLGFVPYHHGDALSPNRYGIPEPDYAGLRAISARSLDLMLVPLVAFDDHGNRLGMGGGYYDRTLAFLWHRRHWRKPRLLGYAHECQHVSTLTTQPWDIPLDGIATETRLHFFAR